MRTGRGSTRPVECLAVDRRNYDASTSLSRAGQRQEKHGRGNRSQHRSVIRRHSAAPLAVSLS